MSATLTYLQLSPEEMEAKPGDILKRGSAQYKVTEVYHSGNTHRVQCEVIPPKPTFPPLKYKPTWQTWWEWQVWMETCDRIKRERKANAPRVPKFTRTTHWRGAERARLNAILRRRAETPLPPRPRPEVDSP